jgi:hypothetical protein
MVDVKKLTTTFLVLSSIASLIALYFSGSLLPRTGPPRAALAPVAPPDNAFLVKIEHLPIALRPNLSGRETNLTEVTAKNLAEVIVALNPAGPRTIGGQAALVLPTTTILTAYLTMASADQFKLSDLWSRPEARTTVAAGSDDAAASQAYAQSFREITKGTFGDPDFLTQLKANGSTDTDPKLPILIATAESDAIRKLNAVPVPPSLAEFHNNFLTFLEDQRNVMTVLAMTKQDPMKSLIVLKGSDVVGKRIANDFTAAIDAYNRLDREKFARIKIDPWNAVASALRAVADKTIFTPTAYALSLSGANPENKCDVDLDSALSGFFGKVTALFSKVPVIDSTAEKELAGILTLEIMACKARVLTQEAKVGLVNGMNAKTLNYIQGNKSDGGLGDPRVITNYQDYFNTAAEQGEAKAYKDISSNICQEFLPDVQQIIFDPTSLGNANINGKVIANDTLVDNNLVTGGGFGNPGVNGTGQGCPIKNQLDPAQFFNDFQSGGGNNGWDGFFALLTNPENTELGTIAGSHDTITGEAAQATAAAQAKSIANQGYQSDVTCTDSYKDDNGNTVCTHEEILSPGSDISARTDAAITSVYGMIQNANDLAELNSALADSLDNQLIDNPQQGLTNLTFQTGNGLAGFCQSLNVPGLPTNPALAACNNMIGQIMAQFTKYLNILQSIQSIIGLFL